MKNALKIINVWSPPGQPNVTMQVDVGVLTDEGHFASVGPTFSPDGWNMNTTEWTDADLKKRALSHAVYQWVPAPTEDDPEAQERITVTPYAEYIVVGMDDVAL